MTSTIPTSRPTPSIGPTPRTVDTSSELVTTITEQATTEFADTELQARTTYYYRVYFVDTVDTYSPSNSTSAMTLGVTLPFNDDFETDTGVWTFTGEWGPGRRGRYRRLHQPRRLTWRLHLTTSTPGPSPASILQAPSWPILSFRRTISISPATGDGSRSRSTVVPTGRSSTAPRPTRPTGSTAGSISHRGVVKPQVWIRFLSTPTAAFPPTVGTSTTSSSVRTPSPDPSGYPFFDGFEEGAGDWLNGSVDADRRRSVRGLHEHPRHPEQPTRQLRARG